MSDLPEVDCVLVMPHGTMKIVVTPDELVAHIPLDFGFWAIGVDYEGMNHPPFFDCDRVVVFRRTEKFPWRASDQEDLDANIDARLPGIRRYLYLGLGWESRSIDLYWGLIRKAISLHREADPMLAMVYESALAGSK